MAPSYKLIYFDMKGRAELSKLLFATAGVDYEYVCIKGSDWPAIKPTMQFGQLPALQIDGKLFAQSMAIANYLANEFGFYGENNIERLQIDQIMELLKEFIFYLDRSFKEPDQDRKASFMKEALEVHSLTYLNHLEKLLKTSTTGYFVGSKLSLADLAVFDIMGWIRDRNASALEQFTVLNSFNEKISSIENVKLYLEQRNKK